MHFTDLKSLLSSHLPHTGVAVGYVCGDRRSSKIGRVVLVQDVTQPGLTAHRAIHGRRCLRSPSNHSQVPCASPALSPPAWPSGSRTLRARHSINLLTETGRAANRESSRRLAAAAYPGPSWVRTTSPAPSSSARSAGAAGGRGPRGRRPRRGERRCRLLLPARAHGSASAAACPAPAATARPAQGRMGRSLKRTAEAGGRLCARRPSPAAERPGALTHGAARRPRSSLRWPPWGGRGLPRWRGNPAFLHELPAPLSNTIFHHVFGRRGSVLELGRLESQLLPKYKVCCWKPVLARDRGCSHMSLFGPTQVACKFPKHRLETRHKERLKLWQRSNFCCSAKVWVTSVGFNGDNLHGFSQHVFSSHCAQLFPWALYLHCTAVSPTSWTGSPSSSLWTDSI